MRVRADVAVRDAGRTACAGSRGGALAGARAAAVHAASVLAAAVLATGCTIVVPVSSDTARVIGGAAILGVVASDLADARGRRIPPLTADRVVDEVDCTRPIPPEATGNLRCAPPRTAP